VSAAGDAHALRERLLRWYRAHRRDLPWRRSADPYAVWISESMLQQTRVETVIPYYERFLARFPDAHTLARAELDEVLELWTGLGYYSRARNLHRAAAQLVRDHDGELPDDPEALRRLPGVGRYTAGAVASIAFDRPEPVVDGNVARVLTRLRDIRADVRSAPVVRRLWQEAAELAAGPAPGDLNQALMELGATVCTPRRPRCRDCPLRRPCAARRAGDPESLPSKAPKPPPRPLVAVAGRVVRRGRLLAVQRPPAGLLGGLWELPGGELLPGEDPATAMVRTLRERTALAVPGVDELGEIEHVFTHRHLRLHVFACKPPAGRVRLVGFDRHRWVSERTFSTLPQGGATRKALALA
jgi:A/G-specific adenine glycosylase